jgi:hypothetical protein
VTADSCHVVLGQGASRAMLYVAMTRGRHTNQAYLYREIGHETDHEHATPATSPQIHQIHRGDKYSAARTFRAILANAERPTTMHAQAERTSAELLPEMVAGTIERNHHRRRVRATMWREHINTAEAWHAGYERMATAARSRTAAITLDAGGLEL